MVERVGAFSLFCGINLSINMQEKPEILNFFLPYVLPPLHLTPCPPSPPTLPMYATNSQSHNFRRRRRRRNCSGGIFLAVPVDSPSLPPVGGKGGEKRRREGGEEGRKGGNGIGTRRRKKKKKVHHQPSPPFPPSTVAWLWWNWVLTVQSSCAWLVSVCVCTCSTVELRYTEGCLKCCGQEEEQVLRWCVTVSGPLASERPAS